MTPEERRAQLAAELDTLLDAVVSIGPHSQRDADAGAPEGAFLTELERQLNEKTAELEALNARMNTFSYRFRATSRGLLWLVWLAAAGMLVFSFTLAPFLGPGYQAVFLPLALACIAWAVWASIPPKV